MFDKKGYQRDYMRRKRSNKVEGLTPDEAPIEVPPPEWAAVIDYIKRPSPGMANLERLQRIAGSLGKQAHLVEFSGLTMEDIGKVLTPMPAKF